MKMTVKDMWWWKCEEKIEYKQRKIRIDLSRVRPLFDLYFWRIGIKGKRNILEDNIVA